MCHTSSNPPRAPGLPGRRTTRDDRACSFPVLLLRVTIRSGCMITEEGPNHERCSTDAGRVCAPTMRVLWPDYVDNCTRWCGEPAHRLGIYPGIGVRRWRA